MPLTDPSLDLQTAITEKLQADPAITAIVGDRIYDRIPNVPQYPYISFGDTTVNPELADGIDATETFITIHAWDRFLGFDKTKSVGVLVITALHDSDLETTGCITQSILLESVVYLRDPDGLTSHGVLTFSILTDAGT